VKKIVVLGIGNLLLQDEGVGIHVIEALKKETLPENVELVDGAVAGFDLLPVVHNCDALSVVDAIKTNDAAGTVYRFNPEEITVERNTEISLHAVDFFQVLELAKRYKRLPPTVIIAVVPAEMGWGMELSALVSQKMPKLVEMVKEEAAKAAVS